MSLGFKRLKAIVDIYTHIKILIKFNNKLLKPLEINKGVRQGCQLSPTLFNLLKPNDIYICRTATLTSRRYILNIYSTNIHTEYFKHAA